MTEVAVYRQSSTELNRVTTDDWFDAFGSIVKLSEYVADTEFVPEVMRRRPAAVAACVLTGREMGIPPMAALRMLHVIKGKVGQSAELMRAQVFRAGHEIRDKEVTDQRVILEGRRRGETDWTPAVFTADDARKARIDLGSYPKDKLYARASSRLCRRKFSDVIAGLPTIDELEDGHEGDVIDMRVAPDSRASERPVQRKRQPRKVTAKRAEPDEAQQAERASDVDGLLSDEPDAAPDKEPDKYEPTNESSQADQGDLLDESPDTERDEPITKPQLQKLSILRQKEGYADTDDGRADWFSFVQVNIGRYVGSNKDLTKAEASVILDVLDTALAQDNSR